MFTPLNCYRVFYGDGESERTWNPVNRNASEEEAYYCVDDDYVHIYTKHFSDWLVLGEKTIRTVICGCLQKIVADKHLLGIDAHLFYNPYPNCKFHIKQVKRNQIIV